MQYGIQYEIQHDIIEQERKVYCMENMENVDCKIDMILYGEDEYILLKQFDHMMKILYQLEIFVLLQWFERMMMRILYGMGRTLLLDINDILKTVMTVRLYGKRL